MAFGKKKYKDLAIDNQAQNGQGQINMPNPGEMPPDYMETGMPLTSLGQLPLRATRAGGGEQIDNGARVAYLRNLEFAAGGRSAMIRTGTTGTSVPNISATTGQVQVASATGDEQAAGTMDRTQPPMPGLAKGGGDQLDNSGGDHSPERRRDKRVD